MPVKSSANLPVGRINSQPSVHLRNPAGSCGCMSVSAEVLKVRGQRREGFLAAGMERPAFDCRSEDKGRFLGRLQAKDKKFFTIGQSSLVAFDELQMRATLEGDCGSP